jgi:hypothetical protein
LGVGVFLAWIVHCRAIVDITAQAVAVNIVIRVIWAGIASIPDTVAVIIPLACIRHRRAIVTEITHVVAVLVFLQRIIYLRAVVTGIPENVGVAVELVGVGHGRTVVDIAADAVTIAVVVRVIRAGIASMPSASA